MGTSLGPIYTWVDMGLWRSKVKGQLPLLSLVSEDYIVIEFLGVSGVETLRGRDGKPGFMCVFFGSA